MLLAYSLCPTLPGGSIHRPPIRVVYPIVCEVVVVSSGLSEWVLYVPRILALRKYENQAVTSSLTSAKFALSSFKELMLIAKERSVRWLVTRQDRHHRAVQLVRYPSRILPGVVLGEHVSILTVKYHILGPQRIIDFLDAEPFFEYIRRA